MQQPIINPSCLDTPPIPPLASPPSFHSFSCPSSPQPVPHVIKIAHNPELDCSSRLTFPHCPSSCSLSHSPLSIDPLPLSFPSMIISRLLPEESVDPDSLAQLAALVFTQLHHDAKNLPFPPAHLHSKTTHSTTLTAKNALLPSMATIPLAFHKILLDLLRIGLPQTPQASTLESCY